MEIGGQPQSGQIIQDTDNRLLFPRLVADDGDAATKRFFEFFAVTIRNKNTREAYIRAARSFFAWCDDAGIGQLVDIEPIHVAAYVESLMASYEASTVKQHLAGPLEIMASGR